MTPLAPRPARRGLVAATAALLVLAAGCGGSSEPTPTPRVALVVAGHAHSTGLAPTDPALVEVARSIVDRHADVVVVPVDGAPRPATTLRLPDRTDNDLQRADQDARYLADLLKAITAARPSTVEADYLTAIDIGCRAVASGPPGSEVDVVGSGLSTVTLRLQDDLLAPGATAIDVVDGLRAARSIPALDGCPTIRWLGFGQTTAPQPPLTIAARTQLTDIYRGVAAAGHGRITFLPTPLIAGPVTADLPAVSLVPIDGTPPVLPSVLTDSQVGFRPGSAELRDLAAARAALAAVASDIRNGGLRDVWVVGTTSSYGPESSSRALSRARAAAVCDVLVDDLGVPAAVLHPVGVGVHFAGFVPDRNADGSLDEVRAAHNRLVLLRTDPPAAR